MRPARARHSSGETRGRNAPEGAFSGNRQQRVSERFKAPRAQRGLSALRESPGASLLHKNEGVRLLPVSIWLNEVYPRH